MLPIDKLTPVAVDWCRSVGSRVSTVTEIRDGHDQAVLTAIQAGIDRANQSAISRAQLIQKWTILPRDFSIQGGELGQLVFRPTMLMHVWPILIAMSVCLLRCVLWPNSAR